MADETIADTTPTLTESKPAGAVSEKPKTRATRKKTLPKTRDNSPSTPTKAVAKPRKSNQAAEAALTSANQAIGSKRKKYTPAQRTSILASVEKIIKDGATTLKAALQQIDVSEQTYYNWKNAARQTSSAVSMTATSDDLATLVALEAENLKLRKELAEKLRAENVELRKRLGKA